MIDTSQTTIQKSSTKTWLDEKGIGIPYSRTTKHERKQEKAAGKLLKESIALNSKLSDFKTQIQTICQELYDDFMADKEVDATKKPKGNYTWYNFDRSIKIEVAVNEQIDFDDLTITAAKDKLDTFLNDKVSSEDTLIKQLVLDAFQTSGGRLDTKKVMSLLRYKDRIKDKVFQEAMELIQSAIRRPESKTYFRIWAIQPDGKYKNVDLNFSSI